MKRQRRSFRDTEEIKAEIRRRGQRISSLSEALGFAPSTLSVRWKKDRAWPELDSRLATFLGTDLHHLFPKHYHPDGRPKTATRKLRTNREWGPGWRLIDNKDLAA